MGWGQTWLLQQYVHRFGAEKVVWWDVTCGDVQSKEQGEGGKGARAWRIAS